MENDRLALEEWLQRCSCVLYDPTESRRPNFCRFCRTPLRAYEPPQGYDFAYTFIAGGSKYFVLKDGFFICDEHLGWGFFQRNLSGAVIVFIDAEYHDRLAAHQYDWNKFFAENPEIPAASNPGIGKLLIVLPRGAERGFTGRRLIGAKIPQSALPRIVDWVAHIERDHPPGEWLQHCECKIEPETRPNFCKFCGKTLGAYQPPDEKELVYEFTTALGSRYYVFSDGRSIRDKHLGCGFYKRDPRSSRIVFIDAKYFYICDELRDWDAFFAANPEIPVSTKPGIGLTPFELSDGAELGLTDTSFIGAKTAISSMLHIGHLITGVERG